MNPTNTFFSKLISSFQPAVTPAATALAATIADELRQHPAVAARVLQLATCELAVRKVELRRTAQRHWENFELADALHRLANPALYDRVLPFLRRPVAAELACAA